MPAKPNPKANGHQYEKSQIVAKYDYTDAAGALVYQVRRLEPKTFRQCRPDPDKPGSWVWNMTGIERVPYRLPSVLEAVQSGFIPVWVVEGEKDVHAMERAGFVATCNPGGAGKWPESFQQHFNGANEVVVIADKDGPGRKHAQQVASSLYSVVGAVRVIELPDLNGRAVKDAWDWFAAGGESADLNFMAESAEAWHPEHQPEPQLDPLQETHDGDDTTPESVHQPLPEWGDAAAFLPTKINHPDQVIHGLIHKGCKMVLGGASKSRKSWVLLDLGLSVSHGAEWLGFSTTKGKVLFVNFELPRWCLHSRLNSICHARELPNPTAGQFFIWNLRAHSAPFQVIIPKLINAAKSIGFSLIILDPSYKLLGNADENSARDMALLLNSFESLSSETGATLAYASHYAKGNASAKLAQDRIAGSGVIARDADSLILMTELATPEAYAVEAVLRALPPIQPFSVKWDYPRMVKAPELNPSDLKKPVGKVKEYDPLEILKCLEHTTLEDPSSMTEWSKLCGVPRPTLINYAKPMREKGLTATAGVGLKAKHYITEKGRRALEIGTEEP